MKKIWKGIIDSGPLITAAATVALVVATIQYTVILNNERDDKLTPRLTLSNEVLIKYKEENENLTILNSLPETKRFIPLKTSSLLELDYQLKNVGLVPVSFSVKDYDPDLTIDDQPIRAPLTTFSDTGKNFYSNLALHAGEIKIIPVQYEINEGLKGRLINGRKIIFSLNPRIIFNDGVGADKELNMQILCIFTIKDGDHLFPLCNVKNI